MYHFEKNPKKIYQKTFELRITFTEFVKSELHITRRQHTTRKNFWTSSYFKNSKVRFKNIT